MIEELAKASYEALIDNHRLPPWDEALPHVQEVHRVSVRAILTRLREPDAYMIAAGISTRHEQEVPEAWNKATVHIYQAMLSAIDEKEG